MSDTLTCTSCTDAPMVNPPTFEEWLTLEAENISRDMTRVGPRYYDRAGNPISFAESIWLGVIDPGHSIVEHTHFPGDGLVSTVHLYSDHAMPGDPILIFETMVFGVDGWEDYQERYSTEAEAVAGHEATLERINAGEPPD